MTVFTQLLGEVKDPLPLPMLAIIPPSSTLPCRVCGPCWRARPGAAAGPGEPPGAPTPRLSTKCPNPAMPSRILSSQDGCAVPSSPTPITVYARGVASAAGCVSTVRCGSSPPTGRHQPYLGAAFFAAAALASAIIGLFSWYSPLASMCCVVRPAMAASGHRRGHGRHRTLAGPLLLVCGPVAHPRPLQRGPHLATPAIFCGLLAAPFAGALMGAAGEASHWHQHPADGPGVWMVLLVYLLCVAALGWMDFGGPVNQTLTTLGLKQADSGYLGPTFLERQIGISHEQALKITAESDGSRIFSGRRMMVHNGCLPGMLAYAIAGSLLILLMSTKTASRLSSD